MRLVVFRDTHLASIQCCGFWVQVRGTIVGVFPGWWWQWDHPRHRRAPLRRFGVSILTPAWWYDRRTLFALSIGRREFGWRRDFLGGPYRWAFE